MSMVSAIFEKLSATPGVTNLVEDRIYHVDPRQQVAAPYIIYQQIVGTAGVTHGEPAGAKGGLFQFACFAVTSAEAGVLRDTVCAALDTVTLSSGHNPTWEDERGAEYDDAAELFRADVDLSL
jgi:uncharacterized protein DUF3168